jgi:hypothetical protein
MVKGKPLMIVFGQRRKTSRVRRKEYDEKILRIQNKLIEMATLKNNTRKGNFVYNFNEKTSNHFV